MKALAATVVIILLSILCSGILLYNGSVAKYFERSRRDFRKRESLHNLTAEIVLRFKDLAAVDADTGNHPVLEAIRADYAAFLITIDDISSGLNLNFLPDTDLTDPALASFLFTGGNAGNFLAFRESRGFTSDMLEWLPYINEEARASIVSYGWFLKRHEGSAVFTVLASTFGITNTENLYPLVNDLPLININTASPALFKPLLSRASWKSTNVSSKAAPLVNRLESGSVTEGELRNILALPSDHEVFDYLGVKTAFWKISLKDGQYKIEALIAAVPVRGSRTVEEYRLIEARLAHA